MRGHWKRLVRDVGGVVVAIAIGVSAGSALADAAGSKLTLAPPFVQVFVDPPVAAPGVARKIVVNGVWPNGCIPTHAQLGFPPSFARDQALGILLAEPLTLQACTSAFMPYRFELDYTPTTAGQREIVVMTTLASPLGSGRIVTGSAAEPRARYDTSGGWYDPRTSGSGLMIAHDYGATDRFFATWQVFDVGTGLSRWYTIQEGRWDATGMVYEGRLYESRAAVVPCLACPAPASSLVDRGRVRLAFSVNGANGGLDARMFQLPDGGEPLPIADLQRFLPTPVVLFQ